jgi:hypothetical protein
MDICKEQELKLMKLTSQLGDETTATGPSNTFVRSPNDKGLHSNNSNQRLLENLEPLLESQTEVLRGDLEAMRNKVLNEITKSNRLKEATRELELRHDR